MLKFEPENKPITLLPGNNISEKIAFVQNLYNKADEKINHIDKLRQQYFNYALVIFSGLMVFVLNYENTKMQALICFGIALLMWIFCLRDHKLHKYIHGFEASMYVFAQVIAFLLNKPKEEVEFLQYCYDGEKHAKWWKSRQTRIYIGLIMVSIGVAISFSLK